MLCFLLDYGPRGSRSRGKPPVFLASWLQDSWLQVIFLQFPEGGGAADPELARHHRHLGMIMGKREFDRLRLQLIERPRVASCIKERKDIWIAHFHPDELFFAGRLARGRPVRRGGPDVEPPGPCCDLRKFGDRQLAAIGEDHGPEDSVFQLPDIAWPIVAGKQGKRLGADPAQPPSFLGAKPRAKPLRERADVLAPAAQRWNRNWKHIDAVKEVLAEASASHLFDQIAIGRENQANVGLDRAFRAGWMNRALLQGIQESCLRDHRQFANPVEEKRAAMRLDEFAGNLLAGAAAKQDGLGEMFRQGGAIDSHESAPPPPGSTMNGACKTFLAGAGLAFEKHGNGRFRALFALPDGAR